MSTPTQDYTLTDCGSIILGRSAFRVEVQRYVSGSTTTWLYGSRGAVYFLRKFIDKRGDDGLRQVISWKSGQPLRVHGNEVQVVAIGDVIEVAPKRVSR